MNKTHQQTHRLTTAILAGFVLALSTLGLNAVTTFAASDDPQRESAEQQNDHPTPHPSEETASPNTSDEPDHTEPPTDHDDNEDFNATVETPGPDDTGQNNTETDDPSATDANTDEPARDAVTTTATSETTGSPELVLDPTSVSTGEAINVSGTNFATGHIDIKLEDETLVAANADEDGNFSTIIQLTRDLNPGEYVIVAHDKQDQQATAQLTVSTGEDTQQSSELELTTNTTEVRIGDTIRLRLEGPEELLAAHSTGEDPQEVAPHSELTNTVGQRGVFTESGPTLVDAGEGYRVFEYVVPEHQPTNNVFDDVGAITHGVYFTFFTTIETDASTAVDDGANITSNEITVVVNGTATEPDAAEAPAQEPIATLTIQPEQIDLTDFVGDPDEGAGVLHRVEDLAPGTQVNYTINGPSSIEVLTDAATANNNGTVEFRIHGYESRAEAGYLGSYTTAVSFDERNEESGELAGNFTVTGQAPADETPTADELEPLGSSLATTGSSHTMLYILTGLLLLVAGAIIAYTNRKRLFGPKDRV